MKKYQSGFTLLETAAVLAVIALVVGGIMMSRSMLRTSQIRAAITEYGIYIRAIKEFQDKYAALPGDMSTAESIWGSDTACPNTVTNSTPKVATCNGDGNGHIGDSTTAGVLSNNYEWFRAWQQLADAGMIPGMYTGVKGSGGAAEAIVGTNVPASRLDGAGWTMNFYLLTADGALWGDQYGHIMHLGAYKSADYAYNPVLTPDEAFSIDRKLDDGKPGRGNIRAWRTSVQANCTTTDTSQDNQAYNSTYSSGRACSLLFLMRL